MNKITQDMQFRQSLLRYASRYGVTKAAIRYKVNRQYVYRWQRRYDGTWESLKDRLHRPKSHPNQHTDAELKLIRDMRRRNPHALRKILCKMESKQLRKQITNTVFRLENGRIHLPVLAARSMLYNGMRTVGANNGRRHRAY